MTKDIYKPAWSKWKPPDLQGVMYNDIVIAWHTRMVIRYVFLRCPTISTPIIWLKLFKYAPSESVPSHAERVPTRPFVLRTPPAYSITTGAKRERARLFISDFHDHFNSPNKDCFSFDWSSKSLLPNEVRC